MRLPVVLLSIALSLCACTQATTATVTAQTETAEAVVDVQQEVAEAVTAPVLEQQTTVSEAVAPVVVAVQEAVQSVIPSPPPAPAGPEIDPRAVDLIIRWEVTSEARYTRALQWPIWPGGASGVTWGIGFDGGHQTRQGILDAWKDHEGKFKLAATSGIVGAKAGPTAKALRDVLTPFQYGKQVFTDSTLPTYMAGARRAYGKEGFDLLPLAAQGALGSVQYNRGGSMAGDRNREKRVIRDECVPRGDVGCIATQIRSMCRLWLNTANGKGLCARREDEARLAVLQ